MTTEPIVTHPSASQDFLFDPALVYASFLGGPNQGGQQVNVVYVDSSGDLYLAGSTNSASFPVTTGVVQPTQGANAGFLSKIDPTGQHLIFSTYLPGFPGAVSAMTVDAAGDIYVAGASKYLHSGGAPLPIPSGSTPFRSSGPIGILKLNPAATTVLAATYFGGSGSDAVGGIAVDSSDVRETTRRPRIIERRPIISSVMPSAKYSWEGSPDRFFRGSTARE